MSKKIIILVVVVLIVIIGLVVIIGGKYSTPGRTLKTMIRAMEKGDIDAYLDCLTEDSQKILIDSGIKEQENVEAIKKGAEDYGEADFKVIEKTEDTVTMKSDKEENAFLVFKKEKAGWKLDLDATFERIFKEAMPSGE